MLTILTSHPNHIVDYPSDRMYKHYYEILCHQQTYEPKRKRLQQYR